jgi:hypothetical protein
MKLFTTAADPTKPVGNQEGGKADGMRPTPIGEGTAFRYLAVQFYPMKLVIHTLLMVQSRVQVPAHQHLPDELS